MARRREQWHRPPNLAPENYVDNRIYTDETIFAEEQEKIFTQGWKFVCHESEVASPGDFRTTTVAGKPLAIICGDDGEVRVFYNVCPHRGAVILRQPAGNEKYFTCLLHRWSFDRQGDCVAITSPEGYREAGLEAADCGLCEVRSESHLGLIFVNLDGTAGALTDFLGAALDTMIETLDGQPLELFHYHRTIVNSNWKSWIEVGREIYHEFLHVVNRTTSFQAKDYLNAGLRVSGTGHLTLEPVEMAYDKYDAGLRKDRNFPLPGMAPNQTRLVDLFPDFTVLVRTTAMRIDSLTPLSPTETLVEFRGLGVKGEAPEVRAGRINDHNEYWGPFGRNLPEDTVAVVEQMRGMRDGASRFSIIARSDDPPRFSDATLRDFYGEWSRIIGRAAHDPFGERTARAAE